MVKFDADRLRTQLKLAKCRLEILLKQHRNMSGGRRQEIANLLAQGHEDRARVKHLIRDDYLMEAYELLLARVDPDLLTPCKSLIYAAGRVDVTELDRVREQLIARFGRDMADVESELGRTAVDPSLIVKLSIRSPETKLTNHYMAAIAQIFGVVWNPPAEEEPLVSLATASMPEETISFHSSSFSGQIPASSPTAMSAQYSSVFDDQPPSYSAVLAAAAAAQAAQQQPPSMAPPTAPASSSSSIPDFDELQRRFQALKRN